MTIFPATRRTLLVSLLLAVATLVVYWPVRSFEFVTFDDPIFVTENPHVRSGLTWTAIKYAFTTPDAQYWIPLTWLSVIADYQLHQLNAGGYHVTNLILHTVATVLLFAVLVAMTGATWRSAFVAALFALHPLHVESVAWVTERKDVLSAVFWMLTLGAYVRFVRTDSKRWLGVTSLCLALGLMAKPMVMTLPFVLLLLDYWPLNRAGSAPLLRRLAEKSLLLLLAIGSCVISVMAYSNAESVLTTDHGTVAKRLSQVAVSYVAYLWKSVWPLGLSCVYPSPTSWPLWQVVGATALLAGVTTWVVKVRRRRPYLAVGWFWYLGTLAPVIGLIEIGPFWIADRYMYLPLIGLGLAAAWGASDLVRRWPAGRKPLAVAAVVTVALAAWLTTRHLPVWRDSQTLFENAVATTKNNALAHNNLGAALAARGQLTAAMEHYTEAVRLKPDHAEAYNNLGIILIGQGRVEEAIRHYNEALRLKPGHANAHNNLGNALAAQGQLTQAIAHFTEAVRLKPNSPEPHNNLGKALAEQGHLSEALRHYTEALRLKPTFWLAHNNLGAALAEQGHLSEALRHYTEALRLKPDYAEAHNNLGNALAAQGRLTEAIGHYTAALRLKPDYAEAHNNLGAALVSQGKLTEALAHYTEAVRLKPNFAEAHYNLGDALVRQGRLDEAKPHLEQARRLDPRRFGTPP